MAGAPSGHTYSCHIAPGELRELQLNELRGGASLGDGDPRSRRV